MSKIVAAARAYLGVPFRHRGRSAHALDCAGLAWRAYADCGVVLPDFRLYGKEPSEHGLVRHVANALGAPFALGPVSASQLQPGDILIMRFRVDPHHVVIVTDYRLKGLAMIHSDGHAGRVIEHRMAADHVARVTHAFRRPV